MGQTLSSGSSTTQVVLLAKWCSIWGYRPLLGGREWAACFGLVVNGLLVFIPLPWETWGPYKLWLRAQRTGTWYHRWPHPQKVIAFPKILGIAPIPWAPRIDWELSRTLCGGSCPGTCLSKSRLLQGHAFHCIWLPRNGHQHSYTLSILVIPSSVHVSLRPCQSLPGLWEWQIFHRAGALGWGVLTAGLSLST